MKRIAIAVSLVLSAISLTALPAYTQEDPYAAAREAMVKNQLKGRNITDKKVLGAMATVPRHKLVPKSLWSSAYKDFPLPIGEGQTISQPYVVAYMTQAVALKGTEKVLEIGTGSGYQAAVLAKIVPKVYSVEIRPKLAATASENLKKLGYDNTHVRTADGYFGWEEHGPYDAIIVTAAVNHVPPPLLKQLKPGGRLILPLGSTDFLQTLTLITKDKDGNPKTKHLMDVRFVPLIGKAREGPANSLQKEDTSHNTPPPAETKY